MLFAYTANHGNEMHQKICVRKCVKADIDGIMKIYDDGYREAKRNKRFGDWLRLTVPDAQRKTRWKRDFYSSMIKGDRIAYVATDGKSVIGFCYILKKEMPESEMSHVGILGFRVADGYRSKGIGTRLVRSALHNSMKKFDVVEARVISFNGISKAVLRKFGFKKWGTAPGYIKRDGKYINLDHMYLKL